MPVTPDEIDAFNPWPELARIFQQSNNNLERLANGMSDNDTTFTPDIGDRVRITAGAHLEGDGLIGAIGVVTDIPSVPWTSADGTVHHWIVTTEVDRRNVFVSDMELVEDDVIYSEPTEVVADDGTLVLSTVEEIITSADYEIRANAIREAFEILVAYGVPLDVADVLDMADFMVDGGAA